MKKKKVVILGAGITGLTAGWKLAEKGYDTEVFEKESFLGGLSSNSESWGLSFDTMPHVFHVHDEKCYKEFMDLIGDELVGYDKHVELKYQGMYVRYPLTPLNMFFSLDFVSAMKCGINLVYARIKNRLFKLDDSSAESWIINRYGKSLYNIVFKNYTTKIWGLKPSELSPNFARLKIPNISFVDLFVRMFSNSKKFFGRTYKDAPAIIQLYYPKKGGIVRISEKLCERIREKGGKVHLNAEVKGINIKGNNVESVSCVLKDGTSKTIKADYYFSTIPLVVLAELIEEKNKNSEVLSAAKSLNYRSLVMAHLLIDKERVFKPQSIYYPTNRIFNRVSDIRSFDKSFEPKDKTILSAEVTCQIGDEIWNMDREEFIERVIKDLEGEDVVKKEMVVGSSVVKIPYAYPRYDLGYEKNIIALVKRFRGISNLFVGGRQGLFRYLDMDVCFETGLLIAEKIENNDFSFKTTNKIDIDGILLS